MTTTIKMLMVTLAANLAMGGSTWACQTWICSVASAVAVDEDGTVGPPDLGERDRPTFLRVDPAKKELTILAPESRRGEVTKLDTVHEVEGTHIFSGVENGRNVSLIITAEGRMTLSVIADGVVWSVFGNALPDAKTKPVEETKETLEATREPAAPEEAGN
ncbi:MAG: hypothetical protein K8S94_04095 [Planctomycetia bacterium]|nr:hypothetical protein [Planctomycetia bacterium]